MATIGGGESFTRGSTLAIAGAAWKLLIQVISLAVLSRLIPPADFGAMAILMSISAVALLLGDLGLSTAALRAPHITAQQKSNLFWINVTIGVALWAVAVAVAQPVSTLFGSPSLLWGLPVIASTVFFALIGAQARTEINRRSDFTSLTWIEAIAGLAGVIAAICLALAGLGLLALIMQQVVSAGIAAVLFMIIARWWPSLPRRTPGMGEFLKFGTSTFAAQGVTFLSNNVDVWLIGRLWGFDALGQYNRAMQMAKLPVTQLLPPLTRVALPHLRGIDPQSGSFSARVRRWRSGVTQPLILGLALIAGAASPLVAIVLGPEWGPSAALVPPLVLGAMFQVMGSVPYWVLLTVGTARSVFFSEAIGRLLMIAAMVAVAPLGVTAIAWAGVAGTAVIWLSQSLAVSRRSALAFSGELLLGLRYLFMAAVTFASAHVIGAAVDGSVGRLSPVIELLVRGGGWLLGLLLLTLILPPLRRDIMQLVARLRRSPSSR